MKTTVSTPTRPASRTADATRKLVILALLSAIGYISKLFIKIPVILFLKYEPKDLFLVLAGILYGPLAAFSCAFVNGLLELLISDTGLIGMIMNIVSSTAFACTASFVYKKRKDIAGLSIGLCCSVVLQSVAMLLWNYLISPLYMGISRAEIVPMLTSVFLPFNLLKSAINAALTLMIYRPFLRVLHLCGYPVSDRFTENKKSMLLVYVIAAIMLILCIAVIIKLKMQ